MPHLIHKHWLNWHWCSQNPQHLEWCSVCTDGCQLITIVSYASLNAVFLCTHKGQYLCICSLSYCIEEHRCPWWLFDVYWYWFSIIMGGNDTTQLQTKPHTANSIWSLVFCVLSSSTHSDLYCSLNSLAGTSVSPHSIASNRASWMKTYWRWNSSYITLM